MITVNRCRRLLACSRDVKIVCIVLLTFLSMGVFTVTPAGAVPVWTVDGIQLVTDTAAAVRLVGHFEVSFTEGTSRYTVSCNTDGAARGGKLLPTSPGTDSMFVFGLPVANCTVKIGTSSTGCVVSQEPLLLADSNSTLGGTGPSSYTDAFATFKVRIDLAARIPEVCNPAGNYEMNGGAAMTGTWSNSASQVTFNGVSVTLGTFTTPAFSAVYQISSPTRRVGVGEGTKGPDWLINSKLLASGSKDETAEESTSVEISSEKFKIKCTLGDGTSTITGGEPATGTSDFALEKCSVAGATECTAEEPVELGKPKSLLALLKEEHLGAKFEGFSSTITVSGEKCSVAGKYTLEGNATALYNKTSEEFEFTEPAQEGSTLKLGGGAAKLIGKFKNSLAAPTGVTG